MPPSMAPKAKAANVAIGVARRKAMSVLSLESVRNRRGARAQHCWEQCQQHYRGPGRKRRHSAGPNQHQQHRTDDETYGLAAV